MSCLPYVICMTKICLAFVIQLLSWLSGFQNISVYKDIFFILWSVIKKNISVFITDLLIPLLMEDFSLSSIPNEVLLALCW
jgi:hypothetical protein